jgi:hypothetical protein
MENVAVYVLCLAWLGAQCPLVQQSAADDHGNLVNVCFIALSCPFNEEGSSCRGDLLPV